MTEDYRTADSTVDYETHHNEFSVHKDLYPWINDSRKEFTRIPTHKLYSDKSEQEVKSLENLAMNVLPDFELPDPGEGVQTNASDFFLREFSNERLFQELNTRSFEKLAHSKQVVDEDFDFQKLRSQINQKA